jgi:hypothetical protein
MSGRPIINEQDHPQEKWPLYLYNYWLDAEMYFDKLEEVLETIKRENEAFFKENEALKIHR